MNQIIQRRESNVSIQPKVPQVTVTVEKPIADVEEAPLKREIMKEVPTELPVPKFSKPKSVSKLSGFFGRGKAVSKPTNNNNVVGGFNQIGGRS